MPLSVGTLKFNQSIRRSYKGARVNGESHSHCYIMPKAFLITLAKAPHGLTRFSMSLSMFASIDTFGQELQIFNFDWI